MLTQFDAMDKNFLGRIKKHRPQDLLSVGAADNIRILDYYGERIHSVKDYKYDWVIVYYIGNGLKFRETLKRLDTFLIDWVVNLISIIALIYQNNTRVCNSLSEPSSCL